MRPFRRAPCIPNNLQSAVSQSVEPEPKITRRDNEGMPRKEVYCETCGSDQPMIEHEPQKDELNRYPWYDITCGTCYSIIATVQIVPDGRTRTNARFIKGPLRNERQWTLSIGAALSSVNCEVSLMAMLVKLASKPDTVALFVPPRSPLDAVR